MMVTLISKCRRHRWTITARDTFRSYFSFPSGFADQRLGSFCDSTGRLRLEPVSGASISPVTMFRTVVSRTASASQSVRVVRAARSVSTKGPLEATVTSKEQHPTIKDKDEKVLAKAREVANDPAIQQSSNREVVWSNSQQPRQDAWHGPRFEQTDFSLQPQPQAAIELIAKQPIRMETRRVVSCDGGGGALGHPKVYINLDKSGEPNVCSYCKSKQSTFNF